MKNWPKISIVILNKDGKDFTIQCLGSVFQSDYPDYEIIMVDNGSKDGSQKLIKKSFGQKKNFLLIENPDNQGFAGGSNQGAEKATGDWLMFLNNDTIVEKNWLKNLMNEVLANNDVAAAGCKQRLLLKKDYLDAVGGYLDHFGWSEKKGYQEKDKKQYDKEEEVFYGHGSSLLVRRDVFWKIGGFDKDYIAYYEEVDLCWRIWLAGYKIIFAPGSVIYHYGGGWQKKHPNSSFFYLMRRNHLITLLKNYSCKDLILRLPVVLVFYFLSVLVFLFKGDFSRAASYLRAVGWNIKNFNQTIKKRKKIQRNRKVSDGQIPFSPKIYFIAQFL